MSRIIVFGRNHTPPGPPKPTLEELARIRGAMWSVRWNGRYGPRPGSPDNILAMDYYEWYNPDERAKMIQIYKSRNYTHAVTGPMIDTGGYHGQFPTQPTMPTDQFLHQYLDCMQEWWNAGIYPVHFIHPDGWTFEQTRDQFTEFYSDSRVKQLLPILVPTGWEPTRYDWSSKTWAAFCEWSATINPDALILIHTVADVDAPVGSDSRYTDNDNGKGWANVVPFIHGWLIQNGAYSQYPTENPDLAYNFAAQFMKDGPGAATHSVAWHFAGNAGWPTFSRWGATTPIKLYAGEETAYNSYWNNLPESCSQAWGDLALKSGADGALDGCTLV